MPDTPIDLSEGIQSVRLKVPTAEVPIPPEGFAQLHTPSPGELALRLPDGSVVAVGGGGGGGGVATLLVGPGGLVEAANTDPRIGININAVPGTGIGLTGELLDQFAKPLGFHRLVKTTLTAAQVIAAATAPPTVVAGVEGAVLVPVAFAAVYHYAAPASVGVPNYRFVWGDLNPDSHPLTDQPIYAVNLFGGEQDMFWFAVAQPYGSPLPLADVVGQPIKMVGSADLDSLAGTIDVYTWVRAVVV